MDELESLMAREPQLNELLAQPAPVLALAPMQDVTDLPFWQLLMRYGGADLYYTEYFRVYATSHPDQHLVRAILENPTGRPVIAQMIGEDLPALVRTAQALQRYPVAAIDLNLGCPAPVVCRKNAGGGLLREPERLDGILGALREAVLIPLTVKTRLGFDTPAVFDRLLELFVKHAVDLVAVHARTVREMYRSEVHYEYIARAVSALSCPVLANGNIGSPAKAWAVLQQTGARGLMVGRGAIRNPWLFDQIRRHLRQESVLLPTGRQVLAYLQDLFATVRPDGIRPRAHIEKMKKYLNYIGLGVEPTGGFLHQIRRVTSESEFHRVCTAYLDHDRPMSLEPYALSLGEHDVLAGVHV